MMLYFRPNCCTECDMAEQMARSLNIETVEVLEVFPCQSVKRMPKLVDGECDYLRDECLKRLITIKRNGGRR
jgi:hypothetical protein